MNQRSKVINLVLKYGAIVIGSLFYGVGFHFFLYANSIPTGGLTGVAMIINRLTQLPVGVLTIVMNIPLFAAAWKRFGTRFIFASLVGTVLSSAAVDLLALVDASVTTDVLLACIFGGVVKGFGLGLIYLVGGTTGGSDIAAKFLRQRFPYVNFGTLVLAVDVMVIAAYACIFHSYESALYAAVTMFCCSKVVDLVLYGAGTSKICFIISEQSVRLKEAITGELHRGVTLLQGRGAWSGQEKQVIFCVIKRQQITEIRRIVRQIDVNAFFIVSNASDVFGRGFGDISDDA